MNRSGAPMLVWINGPFGVGKSSAAEALRKHWSGSLVFDPEQIGFMLRKVVPSEFQTGDFQDLPLWRRLTRETISGLMEDHCRVVIVPMTLINERYFEEIVGELRKQWTQVYHFTLRASGDTVRRRLWRRWALPWSTKWAVQRVDRCLAALDAPEFAVHIPTDNRSVQDVADDILSRLPAAAK